MDYELTILNWEKHNPKHKKNYKKFMISNGIFMDQKIAQLSPTQIILFMYLLCIASELGSESVRISVGTVPKYFRIDVKSMWNSLKRFEELQLVSISKTPPNRIELKELNRIELKEQRAPSAVKKSKSKKEPGENFSEDNKKIWDEYFNAYRYRYGVEPVRNARVNSQVSQLRQRIGVEDAIAVVNFFLTHNDSWYLKQTHSFGVCLRDAETLRTQMLNGRAITSVDVKRVEKMQGNSDLIEAMKRGGF